MHRTQQEGRAADPIGERRAVQVDALPGVYLGLAVKREMVGVLRHQHLGDRRLGRQAALDQPRRCGSLHHHILTAPAGVFGPAHDQNAELGRHDVEPLGDIFADPMQRTRAAGADHARHVDQRVDPRQMGR